MIFEYEYQPAVASVTIGKPDPIYAGNVQRKTIQIRQVTAPKFNVGWLIVGAVFLYLLTRR